MYTFWGRSKRQFWTDDDALINDGFTQAQNHLNQLYLIWVAALLHVLSSLGSWLIALRILRGDLRCPDDGSTTFEDQVQLASYIQ